MLNRNVGTREGSDNSHPATPAQRYSDLLQTSFCAATSLQCLPWPEHALGLAKSGAHIRENGGNGSRLAVVASLTGPKLSKLGSQSLKKDGARSVICLSFELLIFYCGLEKTRTSMWSRIGAFDQC